MTKLLTIFIILCSSQLHAIEYSHTSFKAGLSIPIGDFSKDVLFRDDGFAHTGPGASLQSIFTIVNPGLLAALDVMVLYNPTTLDSLRVIEEGRMVSKLDLSSFSGGAYIYIPVLAGLGLKTDRLSFASLYTIIQTGFNLLAQRSLKCVADEISFDTPVFTNAFAITTGFVFKERFDVALRYLSLGRPEFFYDVSSSQPFGGRRIFHIKSVQVIAGVVI